MLPKGAASCWPPARGTLWFVAPPETLPHKKHDAGRAQLHVCMGNGEQHKGRALGCEVFQPLQYFPDLCFLHASICKEGTFTFSYGPLNEPGMPGALLGPAEDVHVQHRQQCIDMAPLSPQAAGSQCHQPQNSEEQHSFQVQHG